MDFPKTSAVYQSSLFFQAFFSLFGHKFLKKTRLKQSPEQQPTAFQLVKWDRCDIQSKMAIIALKPLIAAYGIVKASVIIPTEHISHAYTAFYIAG